MMFWQTIALEISMSFISAWSSCPYVCPKYLVKSLISGRLDVNILTLAKYIDNFLLHNSIPVGT